MDLKRELFDVHRERWETPLEDNYRVVVIGAGIGGLSAGIALAQRGIKVLVVDRHIYPGGCCTSFLRRGMLFDAAVHNLAGASHYASYGTMLRQLGIKHQFYSIAPGDTIVTSEWEFTISNYWPQFKEDLKAEFPGEKDGIDRFFKAFQKSYRSIWRAREKDLEVFKNLSKISFRQFLSDFIKDGRCQNIIAGQWPYLAVPPSRLSALEGTVTLGSYILQGMFYPHGGMQALANAYLDRLEEVGGTARLKTEVSKVRVLGGGEGFEVVLSTGEMVRAEKVVSNIDPAVLVELLEPSEAAEKVSSLLPSRRRTQTAFLIYLAFQKEADLSNIPWGFYFPKGYESLDGWIFLSRPTEKEEALTPNGEKIINTMIGYTGPVLSREEYRRKKSEVFEWLMGILERRSPNLRQKLVYWEGASPSTIERYTGSRGGSVYGWESSVGQSWTERFPQKAPVEGLFFAGHWTQPGSGVPAVTLSGLNAAALLAEEIP